MSDSSEASSPGIVHEFPREWSASATTSPRGFRPATDHHSLDPLADQNGGTGLPSPGYRAPMYMHPYYLPGGNRSLSGISIRAFGLGIALGFCVLLTVELVYFGYGLWRAPCFVATLAMFHYLEFDSTARYNPPDARLSSFLLLSNGMAYASAHTAAMVELLARYWLSSDYKPSRLVAPLYIPKVFPTIPSSWTVMLGFALIVVGQMMRSLAMRQAKTNFNHIVQWTKKPDHVLVTDGVYAFSRHPSYFGFFWWGLGTQIMLGNRICFVVYGLVLWRFFHHRITRTYGESGYHSLVDTYLADEERHLVSFFGQAYVDYRNRVPVRIPFIR